MNIKDLCRIVLTYGEDGIRVASSLCDYSIKCENCPFSSYNNPDNVACSDDCNGYYLKKAEEYLETHKDEPEGDMNWEAFKKGEIVVHCLTEELADDFLFNCELNGIKWASGKDPTTYGNKFDCYEENSCYLIGKTGRGLLYGNIEDTDLDLEEGKLSYYQWKEQRKGKGVPLKAKTTEREYSLIEIIEKAKEGQVFESEYYQVKKINDRQISILDKVTQEWQIINSMVKFKLIKDPVDFNTAFEAYKNGKTITSIVSGETFDNYDSIARFETREIIGQWIIN